MKTKAKWAICIALILASLVVAVSDRRLNALAEDRGRHFVAIVQVLESYRLNHGKYPDRLENAVSAHGGMTTLIEPFGENLHYRREGNGFLLEEKKPKFRSLLSKERLQIIKAE